VSINSDFKNKLYKAILNHKSNKLESAEKLYFQLLDIQPNNPQVNFYLGTLFAQQAKFDLAKQYFNKLLEKLPNDPNINTNLGNIYFQEGDFKKAIKYFDKVIESKPDFVQAYFNKGILLNNIGNYLDATKCFQKVVSIEPNNNIALNILATLLVELGYYKKSIILLSKLLTSDPSNLSATNTLVNIFKIIQLSNLSKKNIIEFEKLFLFLYRKNTINHNELFNNVKILFLLKLKNKKFNILDSKFSLLNNSLVKEVLTNELFQLTIQKSLCRDIFLENFLYKVRKEILISICTSTKVISNYYFDFIISLAEQSFLNEYVMFQSEKEIKLINSLEEKILKTKKIDELEVSILASYIPLSKSKILEKLLNYKSNNILFNDLIKMQIKEPLIEQNIKKSINSLEDITDDISKKVKNQYEENPYPRWRFCTSIKNANFSSVLNNDIRPNKFNEKNNFHNPKILIAGCGTGAQLHSISCRENANILAFDLSLSSLAYAKRKLDETGFKQIEFLHGDILNLHKLNKKFDIIECMGVLHHMKDPREGLRILLNLLKTDGVIKLGLYSEIARGHIVKAREFIRKNKFSSNIHDIRTCRELIKNHEDTFSKQLVNRYDFYSTSNTRDLIFHIQEHRFTIPQISKLLKDFNLEFLGFTQPEIKKKYIQEFSDDKKCVSLKNWHEFEKNNPDIFIGMYNFWLRKV